jgi:hypothetical protein
MFQPSAFNKLNREMISNNQKGKVLQKLFLLHNILLKKFFCTKKLWYFGVKHIWPFFQVVFPVYILMESSLLPQIFLQA